MRRHGVVDSAVGLIPFGHLGWGYHQRSEFLCRAAEYIADGLAEHQWVEYVGDGSPEQLRAELTTLPGSFDISRVHVIPALEFYGVSSGDVVDPDVAVDTRVAAVHQAVADGYTGFRAIVDATAVVRREEQRDAFARFEFLIDEKMAVLPVSALCAYDMTRLDDDASGLVCLHPLVGEGAPAFRIYAEPGAAFALDGEIDAVDAQIFTTTLRRIWRLADGDELVVDARNLAFIDHQQLLALDRLARADSRQVLLRGGPAIISRLIGLLNLTNVRVDPLSAGV